MKMGFMITLVYMLLTKDRISPQERAVWCENDRIQTHNRAHECPQDLGIEGGEHYGDLQVILAIGVRQIRRVQT